MKVRTDRQEEVGQIGQIVQEEQIQNKKVRKKGTDIGLNRQVNRYTGGTDYMTDMIHRIDRTDIHKFRVVNRFRKKDRF